jgi:hypothetical protein
VACARVCAQIDTADAIALDMVAMGRLNDNPTSYKRCIESTSANHQPVLHISDITYVEDGCDHMIRGF